MTGLVILAGMLVGLGVALIVAELVPTHPRLGDVVATTAPALARAPQRGGADAGAAQGLQRLGAWGETHLTRLPFFSTPHDDLDLLGQSSQQFWTEKIYCFLGGLLIPQLTPLLCAVLGVPLPLVVPVGAGLLLGAILFIVPDRQVADQAKRAREEFAAAVVAYVRLVAIRRLSRGGVTSSMHGAARVSDGWMFARIREALVLAEWSGITPWAGLDKLSRQLRIPELAEVADIMSMTESGAAVAGSLTARASSMRDRQLTREVRAAHDRNSALTIPQTLLVFVFGLTLIIPAAASLLSS